jgi:uncharacterized protein DUF5985
MGDIPGLVYILCTITSLVCAAMLFRGYKSSGVRLLLWSSLCFIGLTLENIMLYVDLHVVEDVSLAVWRKLPGLIGVALLLYGLIWEVKR